MEFLFKCSALVLSMATTIHVAQAQELGDARVGLAYAEGVCTECHAVKKGEHISSNQRAPAFDVIANTRGMTDMALRVWFQSPHPSMPNLRLTEKQTDDIIAYIVSLKQGAPRRRGL